MALLFQVISTAVICTMGFNIGFIFVWPASVITQFSTENTTLNRPMTEFEISLLGSLSSIGGLISTLITGLVLDNLGRKKCSISVTLTLAIFWLILILSRQVELVLFSVFLSGASSAVFLIASVYIGEICQESVRGAMTSGNMICYGMGILMSYLLGGSLRYEMMLYIGISLAIGSAGLLCLLKESPTHLMKIGKEKEAAESIAFFRQLKIGDKEVDKEISLIKRTLNPDLDTELTPEREKLNTDSNTVAKEKLSFWQFMRKSRSTRRAFVVNLVAVSSSLFQGLIVVQIYVESLFLEAIPNASPTLCSVLLAAVVVLSSMIAAYLTDVVGRRALMIYASIGTGISCIILGTQLQLHWGPNWITAVFMYVFPVMYTLGAGTVPFVLLAELFLPEVKSIISMIVVEWTWVCDFTALFVFNPLLKAVGWGVIFYIFAAGCFLTSLFCVFFLPETKGLMVEEIHPLFDKKKRRSQSQIM